MFIIHVIPSYETLIHFNILDKTIIKVNTVYNKKKLGEEIYANDIKIKRGFIRNKQVK